MVAPDLLLKVLLSLTLSLYWAVLYLYESHVKVVSTGLRRLHTLFFFFFFKWIYPLFTRHTNNKTFIKNESSYTIYIFKNYFDIVFLIFNKIDGI